MQSELCRTVNLTQSNFSKVENGQRRLNFTELQNLCLSEVDVNYLYTGCKGSGKYLEFLMKCGFLELCCFLEYISSYVAYRYKVNYDNQWKMLYERTRFVSILGRGQKMDQLFVRLRQNENIKQMKMAEILGVDIKKLRDLEKGRSLPDSELLFVLYTLYGISPSVILKDQKGLAAELDFLLEMMEPETREMFMGIFLTLHES